MEPDPQSDQDIRSQKSTEKALQNILIIENIFSFATKRDLLNFRLVNHHLNHQATMRLKIILQQRPVIHRSESYLNDFLALIRTRIEAGSKTSFPFSAFKLNLRHSFKSFEKFAAEAGDYVNRLEFMLLPKDIHENSYHLEKKVALVLSSTPNIVNLKLITRRPVYISRCDLDALPRNFPQLQVVNVQNENWPGILSQRVLENNFSLLSVLISRAGKLKHIGSVNISETVEGNHGLSALQALELQRNHFSVPHTIVDFGSVTTAKTLSILKQLKKSKLPLRIRSLTTEENFDGLSNMDLEDLLQGFYNWLITLSPTLKELILNINFTQHNHPIIYSIPSLSSIEELTLNLIAFEYGGSSKTFHIPLTYNQFPVLRKLNLSLNIRSEETVVTIAGSSLPSVQKLDLNRNLYLLENNPWHRILPNLKSICLDITNVSLNDKKNLTYIFRHFPRVTELQIHLRTFSYMNEEWEIDCWDLLTSSAPRPVSTNVLLHGKVEKQEAVLEVPIDGIYQVPSLENFPALEELHFCVGHRSNLDAVLYMTRTGGLVPLKFLSLENVEWDLKMKVEEMRLYRTILAQVHTRVSIT